MKRILVSIFVMMLISFVTTMVEANECRRGGLLNRDRCHRDKCVSDRGRNLGRDLADCGRDLAKRSRNLLHRRCCSK